MRFTECVTNSIRKGVAVILRDEKLLSEFNDTQIRTEHLDYDSALRLFAGMWEEGRALGVLPLEDPLEEIEVDIKIARILNGV